MKVIVLKNKKEVGDYVSKIIIEAINNKPNLVLGLATGSSVIPLYKKLVKEYKKGNVSFSKVRTFNLDEYLNVKKTQSYRYFMDKHLFSKINISKKNINFPTSNFKDYESKVKKFKIDIQILGIGRNDHIGFNEPGSKFNSKTRKVKLSKTTMKANSRFFQSLNNTPEFAITMGLGTIMNAKKIILIALGSKKAKAVAKAVNSKMNEKIPASILKKHKNSLFVIDKKAAKKL